jgi:guanylate kinase
MKIYILNGKAGSGKTTFFKLIEEKCHNYVYNYSTVDLVKKVAYGCGWNGSKTPENRKFLSDLKDLLTEWDDVPYKDCLKEIKRITSLADIYDVEHDDWAIFIDCREPKEIQKFVDRLGAKTIFIDRKIEDYNASNHADANVENFEYDIVINNNGTLEDLAAVAMNFIKTEGIKIKYYDWCN